MESLGLALAHVKAAAFGAGTAAALRAETAVEELLTNSVTHGRRSPDQEDAIWLGVSASADTLQLRYEDPFDAFDPMPAIENAVRRSQLPIEQRPIGGLGLLMVYRLADEFRYWRENGRNCIELSFLGRRPG